MPDSNVPVPDRRAPTGLEIMRSKFIEQCLTALLSTVLVGFVGWLAGFSEMKFDLAQLNKKMDKMEGVTNKTQGDIMELKLKRAEEDGDIKGRLRVIEEQHRMMPKFDQDKDKDKDHDRDRDRKRGS
jgi:hypothetical protein